MNLSCKLPRGFCGGPCGEQKGPVLSAPALNAAVVLLWMMWVCEGVQSMTDCLY